jgi:multicomponent Na+:H+ antiporter subunit E
VAAPLRTRSSGLITLIASSISLTPGTLTLEIRTDPPTLYVHILHLRTIDETREDIRHLEDLVLAAFPERIDEEAP